MSLRRTSYLSVTYLLTYLLTIGSKYLIGPGTESLSDTGHHSVRLFVQPRKDITRGPGPLTCF